MERISDYRSQDLLAIPIHSIPEDVVELILDHNEIEEVPNSVCQLKHLRHLSMIGNSVSQISKYVGNLSQLEQLNLKENRLTALQPKLCELTNLKELRLMANSLKELPSNFGDLTMLETLELAENELQTLPTSLSKLQSLHTFDASDNKLISLPDEFGKLDSLKILNLSNNSLESLPRSFSNLPQLQTLDLSFNRIAELCPSAAFHSTLRKLYMDENQVSSLPSWFDELTAIEVISIVWNDLRGDALSEKFSIAAQDSLKHLDFSGNSVMSLPQSFSLLKKLEFFDVGSPLPEIERKHELLHGNQLVNLPSQFGDLVSLTELRLDENIIGELPESIGGLINLQIIELAQNRLTRLPDSFCQLRNLQRCCLAMNCLTSLPEHFGQLTNLVWLRLDQNSILSLPQSFENCAKLEHLDLYFNMILEFPECLLKMMNNLKSFNIECNGFKMNTAPGAMKQHEYKYRDPNMANNWRGKIRNDHENFIQDVKTVEGEYESSDDEPMDERTPPGYIYSSGYARKLNTALNYTRKHDETTPQLGKREQTTPQTGESNPNNNEWQDDELVISEANRDVENWYMESGTVNTNELILPGAEDWESEVEKNNPYGTVIRKITALRHQDAAVKAHKQYADFLPGYLHAASLFEHRKIGISYEIADGQFDDAD